MAAVFKVAVCSLLAMQCVSALPVQIERMSVAKMETADMETSATGYAYAQNHGQPGSYVRYDNRGRERYYDVPAMVRYIAVAAPAHDSVPSIAFEPSTPLVRYEPVSAYVPYARAHAHEQYQTRASPSGTYILPHAAQKGPALAPYFISVKSKETPWKVEQNEKYNEQEKNYHRYDDDDNDDDSDDDEEDDDKEEDEEDDHHDDDEYKERGANANDDTVVSGGFEIPAKKYDFQDSEKSKKIIGIALDLPAKVVSELGGPHKTAVNAFEHGVGKKYLAEGHAAHGAKGDRGYNSQHKFDNGEKSKHDKEHREGHYSDDQGHKKAHIERDGRYNHYHQAAKGDNGASFAQEANYKKGHKTTGFHNIYRKDEYKKDTDFYDEDHKAGHFDKHVAYDGNQNSAEGGFKKTGSVDSAYNQGEAGKEANYEKQRDYTEHAGHKGKEGSDAFHEEHANYATKKGDSKGKEYGYKKSHHHPKHYT